MYGDATLSSTFEAGRHATRAVRALVILNMQVCMLAGFCVLQRDIYAVVEYGVTRATGWLRLAPFSVWSVAPAMRLRFRARARTLINHCLPLSAFLCTAE